MKIITKLKTYFLANSVSRVDRPKILRAKNPKPAGQAAIKTDSLAYLAYKYRKQKGLVNRENCDRPAVFFGDEWAF